MRYDHRGDSCLSIWSDAYASGRITFPPAARVLEIGCAEADWQSPMLAMRPDLQITGIDWRACTRPGTTIQGDVLRHDFPDASFDAVVGISSIEHIGLGHYNADPTHAAGDILTMGRALRWLKPGGWAYLDVPYNTHGYLVLNTEARVYDDKALRDRLVPDGFREEARWFADISGGVVDVLPHRALPGYDYVALLLRKR